MAAPTFPRPEDRLIELRYTGFGVRRCTCLFDDVVKILPLAQEQKVGERELQDGRVSLMPFLRDADREHAVRPGRFTQQMYTKDRISCSQCVAKAQALQVVAKAHAQQAPWSRQTGGTPQS